MGRLTSAILGFHPPWPSCISLRMSVSSRHVTLSPCWKGWPSALTLRCSSAGLPGGGQQAPLSSIPPRTFTGQPHQAPPRTPLGRGGAGHGVPAPTEPWQVLLVVEATGRLAHTLEVHLALVPHTVHIGGAICPRHTGHAPARLHVPATDVHHSAWPPFPTWGDKGPTGRLSPCGEAEPQPGAAWPPTHRPASPTPSRGPGPPSPPGRCPSAGSWGGPGGDSA